MANKPSRAQQIARFARLAKNPGTRASIKTADLRGFAGADKLRAQRAQNQQLDQPFVPGSTVTNRQIAQERNAATNLQYGGQEKQLSQQLGDSNYQRDTRLPAWFADYQRQLQAGQDQVAAANAQANQQLVNLGAGDTQLQGQLSPVASQQANAAMRGATADPGAGQREQDAGRIRGMLNSSYGGMLATQGANRVGQLIDTRTRIVPREQIGQQSLENARGQRIQSDQGQLAQAKADFATKYMQDARANESKAVLENATFGLNQTKADTQAKTAAANIDIKRGVDPVTHKPLPKSPSEQKTQAELDFYHKHHYWPPTGAPKTKPDKSGLTPQQQQANKVKAEKFRTEITTARDTASQMLNSQVEDPPKSGKFRHPTEDEVRAALLTKFKDSVVVNAAMELRKRGHLNPGTADRVRKRGVGVPKTWKPPKGSDALQGIVQVAKGMVG